MDSMSGPALRPPPGVIPDFDSPDAAQTVQITASIFCISICTVFLVLQLLTKQFLMHGLKWEDCEICQLLPPSLGWRTYRL